MLAELGGVERVDRLVVELAVLLARQRPVHGPGPGVVRIENARARERHDRAVRIAQLAAAVEAIALAREREARDERVLHAARREARREVRLRSDVAVGRIAHIAARAARHVGARVRAREPGRGIGAVGEAERALRRVDDRHLVHARCARDVADREVFVEDVVDDGGEAVHVDFLDVDVAIAEVLLVVHAGQRLAVEERHAVLRDVVVLLVHVREVDARVAADAERHGRRDTPALELLDLAARRVVPVAHEVQSQADVVADHAVAVQREPLVAVGADAGGCAREVDGLGLLRHEVDAAADRSGAGVDGVRAVDRLDRVEVERVGAAVLRAVAQAVDEDVGVRAEAAQVDAVAEAAAALARAERDARQRGEHVAQREQVLLLDLLLVHGDDRLRRVAQDRRVLRRRGTRHRRRLHVDLVQLGRVERGERRGFLQRALRAFVGGLGAVRRRTRCQQRHEKRRAAISDLHVPGSLLAPLPARDAREPFARLPLRANGLEPKCELLAIRFVAA